TERVLKVDVLAGRASVLPDSGWPHYVVAYSGALGFGRTDTFDPKGEVEPLRIRWDPGAVPPADLYVAVTSDSHAVAGALVRGTFELPEEAWPPDVSRAFRGRFASPLPTDRDQTGNRLSDNWQFATDATTDQSGVAVFHGVPRGVASLEV